MPKRSVVGGTGAPGRPVDRYTDQGKSDQKHGRARHGGRQHTAQPADQRNEEEYHQARSDRGAIDAAQTKVGLARNGNRRHHPDERHAHDHRETCADRTNPDALDEGHQSAGEQIGAYQEGRVRCGQVER